MRNSRRYGDKPYRVAVVHGGPGAPGEMAPVARELASDTGILEPLLTATTVQGQVEELKIILEKNAATPVTLIGFSWGAWLSFIFTARHPSLVKKLILISSGAYAAKYANDIMKKRLSRLGIEERKEALSLMEALDSADIKNKDRVMARFGKLMSKADAYDPLLHDDEILECRYDVYQGVWEEAERMRRSDRLLKLGEVIRCPVVAIQGEYDPHLPEGVKEPLSRVLKDFRFILLEKCGHCPWLERNARDNFYKILRSEIATP